MIPALASLSGPRGSIPFAVPPNLALGKAVYVADQSECPLLDDRAMSALGAEVTY